MANYISNSVIEIVSRVLILTDINNSSELEESFLGRYRIYHISDGLNNNNQININTNESNLSLGFEDKLCENWVCSDRDICSLEFLEKIIFAADSFLSQHHDNVVVFCCETGNFILSILL